MSIGAWLTCGIAPMKVGAPIAFVTVPARHRFENLIRPSMWRLPVSSSQIANVMQSASLLFLCWTLERCSRFELAKEGMLNDHYKFFVGCLETSFL